MEVPRVLIHVNHFNRMFNEINQPASDKGVPPTFLSPCVVRIFPIFSPFDPMSVPFDMCFPMIIQHFPMIVHFSICSHIFPMIVMFCHIFPYFHVIVP